MAEVGNHIVVPSPSQQWRPVAGTEPSMSPSLICTSVCNTPLVSPNNLGKDSYHEQNALKESFRTTNGGLVFCPLIYVYQISTGPPKDAHTSTRYLTFTETKWHTHCTGVVCIIKCFVTAPRDTTMCYGHAETTWPSARAHSTHCVVTG